MNLKGRGWVEKFIRRQDSCTGLNSAAKLLKQGGLLFIKM